MIEFAVTLEASDPQRNIWRSYHVAAGQDLFGDWIVEVQYGRIGAKGRTHVFPATDREDAAAILRRNLKRRESSPTRIGIHYEVRALAGLACGESIADGSLSHLADRFLSTLNMPEANRL
ncbi:WGR domain-containing protein [Methyloterricola oryzae]|uniref:WGR domain-containing protein n=1 Tax=Methyloterricola oryzae TaxID=1495050 RepID=UPI0009E2C862|nr:WGR domain-containing protein [Methyloterricola oryzae]